MMLNLGFGKSRFPLFGAFTCVFFLLPLSLLFSQKTVLDVGIHSHNDYHQNRPLFDAIEAGAWSIEADVFIKRKELKVGHTAREAASGKSLEELYLQPLRELIQINGGLVYPERKRQLILMIDLKSPAYKIMPALIVVLAHYGDICTSYENGEITIKPVTVIISNCPAKNDYFTNSKRFYAVDGRISSIGEVYSNQEIPIISQNWNNAFPLFNLKRATPRQLESVASYVESIHDEGRMIRFWGTPDNSSFWSFLIHMKVDLINTDYPNDLSQFLNKQSPTN